MTADRDELRSDSGADVSARAGQEYAHVILFREFVRRAYDLADRPGRLGPLAPVCARSGPTRGLGQPDPGCGGWPRLGAYAVTGVYASLDR